jgi:hypothetical protein
LQQQLQVEMNTTQKIELEISTTILNRITMKKNLILWVLLMTISAYSQQKTFEKEVSNISEEIENIITTQKDSLKIKVAKIHERMEQGTITKTTAITLKDEAASYHAKRIEELVGVQELLLQKLVQEKTNGKIASEEDIQKSFQIGKTTFRLSVDNDLEEEENKEESYEKGKKKRRIHHRTTSQFVFAVGVNNALQGHKTNSLNESEYQFWRSRFYEIGYTRKMRISKMPSQLYFKYGVSFLWNNLRPKNNQQHLVNGESTILATRIDEDLSESRLRHVQMIFPVHLEWDFSKNKSARFGIGGFVGFKLGTRQYLEYKNSEGVSIEEVQHNNFNMNTINYGLSSYLGYKSTSLYVKYDLNPLFKNTETRNLSMGVRFDFN